MTNVNVTENKYNVTVTEGDTTLVTVKSVGPQGADAVLQAGNRGDLTVSVDGNGTGTAVINSGAINNSKVANDAAIDGLKINPNFGSQNISTTGYAQFGSGNNISRVESGGLRVYIPDSGIYYQNNNNPVIAFSSSGVDVDLISASDNFKVGYNSNYSFTNNQTNSLFNINSSGGQFTVSTTGGGGGERFKILNDSVTISTDLNVTGNIAVSGTVDSVNLSTYQADGGSYLRSDADDIFSGTLTAQSDTVNPVIKINGPGPNFIRFDQNTGDTSDAIDLIYRTTPNTLAFERVSDSQIMFSVDADDQQAIFNGNVDCNSGLDVTGNITTTGQFQSTGSGTSSGLKISNAHDSTFLFFVNNNDNSDFYISYGNSGGPEIKLGHDGKVSLSHAGTTRIQTTTVGALISGNLGVTGTVDGVHIAERDTLFGALTSSSGVLTNGVTGTTQSASDNSTKIATTSYVDTAVSNLVNSAPSQLDTLNEIAAALDNDANFSSTIDNLLDGKLSLTGGTLTGQLNISNDSPILNFVDTNSSHGYRVVVNGGQFLIQDTDDSNSVRFRINQDHHVDFLSNCDFASGIDVTGQIVSESTTGTGSTGLKVTNSNESFVQYFEGGGADATFVMSYTGSGGTDIRFKHNGEIQLNNAGQEKLKTTSAGVSVTGQIHGTSHIDLPTNANLKLGDNDEFEIFHNSSNGNAIIRETGGGILSLQTNGSQTSFWDSTNQRLMAEFNTGGSCTFRHGADTRLSTSSTGIDVTGGITWSAQSNVTGTIDFAADTLATYTPTDTGNGTETATDVAIALRRGHQIAVQNGGFLRNLLGITTGKDVLIGQNNTNALENILLMPGSAGTVQLFYDGHNNSTPKLATSATGVSIDGSAAINNAISLTAAEGSIEASGATGLTLNASNANAYARIRVAGNTRLHIKNDGKIGIGNENPSAALDVTGGIAYSTTSIASGTLEFASTLASYDPTEDGGGSETSTTTPISLMHGHSIAVNRSGHLRNLLKIDTETNGSHIEIGRSNTDYIGDIKLLPGSGHKVIANYDGSPKLQTTSTGIKIDRIVTIDGSTPRIEMKVTADEQSHRIEFYNAADTIVSRIYGHPSGDLELQTGSNGNEKAIKVNSNGAVDLYFDGGTYSTPKLSTTADGVTVDGTLTADDLKISGVSPSLEFEDTNAVADNQRWDFKCGSNTEFLIQALTDAGGGGGNLFKFTRDGNSIQTFQGQRSGITWLTVDNINRKVTTRDLDVTANITLPDNGQLQLGGATGGDSQIYHTGGHAIIKNSTGNLILQDDDNIVLEKINGENMLVAAGDGAVSLYFDGGTYSTPKLSTHASGVGVTGTVEATANLRNSVPTDFWNSGSYFEVGDLGHISTHGSFEFTLTSGGYRRQVDGVGKWKDITVDGQSGFGCQIALAPKTGKIHLRSNSGLSTDDNNPSGAGLTDRMVVSTAGVAVTGNITLPDNGKIILGDDGETDSFITFNGDSLRIVETSPSGSLLLDGHNIFLRNSSESNEGYLKCNGGSTDRNVELFCQGTQRLVTSSTGVAVTGKATMTESNASTSNNLRKITTSTAQPSGGNDGDIWIVVPS